MRLRIGTVAAALASAALVAPGAQAAMRWGQTETVADPGGANVRVAIDARGDALAVWQEGGVTAYSWRAPRGEWRPPRRIQGVAGLIGGQLAMTATGTVLLAYRVPDGRIAVASARPGQTFGAPQLLTPPGQSNSPPEVVVDDEGNAIAGWAVWDRGGQGSRIQVSTRRAGRPFEEPRTIGEGGTGIAPDLAMNPAGAAAAGWSNTSGQAHVSYRPPTGSFGPPERVLFERSGSASPTIAMDVLGNLVVAETRSIPVGDGSGGTHFAIRSPVGTWEEEVALDSGGFLEHVLAEPNGSVSFPFQRTDDSGERTTYFTTRRPDGSLVGPDAISSPNSLGPRIAMNLRGDMLGTWAPKFHPYGAGTEIAIAERPAGGRFGEETVISTDPNSIGSDAGLGEAGQAVVAWTQRPQPDQYGRNVVQARVREDTSLPALPFPPAVSLGPAPDASLGGDGVLIVNPLCSESCVARPEGLLQGAGQAAVARGSNVRLRARRRGRLRMRFSASAAKRARKALRAGERPWVAVSVVARGRSARPVTVTRRVRLTR